MSVSNARRPKVLRERNTLAVEYLLVGGGNGGSGIVYVRFKV
jgi:hypothetical protein